MVDSWTYVLSDDMKNANEILMQVGITGRTNSYQMLHFIELGQYVGYSYGNTSTYYQYLSFVYASDGNSIILSTYDVSGFPLNETYVYTIYYR